MRKAAAEPIVKPRQTLRDVFRRDAFSRSKRKGLTGKKTFERKVDAMIAQIEKHSAQNPLRIGRQRGPIKTEQQALAIRDIIQAALFRRKLLRKPRAAAMLAERMKSTKYAAYFARIAKEAAKRAERKKMKKIIAAKKPRGPEQEKQTKIIAAIAARRRGIMEAGRQWAAKGKKQY